MTAGYRVVATLTSATQKNLKTYLDWIFVGHGAGVTQIVVSSFQPLPVKYEHALAVLADHHMYAKPTSADASDARSSRFEQPRLADRTHRSGLGEYGLRPCSLATRREITGARKSRIFMRAHDDEPGPRP